MAGLINRMMFLRCGLASSSNMDGMEFSKKSNKMTWKNATIFVMTNNKSDGECQPMHYRDITDSIIEQKLTNTVGKTPADTVRSMLGTNKDLFEPLGGGVYRLIKPDLTPVASNPVPEATSESGDMPASVKSDESLIKSYGMFWMRDGINWEHSPKLLGVQSSGASPVDLSEIRGIYMLYDGREVIYVGQAVDKPILKRLVQHTRNRLATRWNRFSWFGIDGITNGCVSKIDNPIATDIHRLADALEGILIEGLEPRQNRRQGDNWGFEYYQKIDDLIVKKNLLTKLSELL